MKAGAVLACYLLLASIYLIYWPHAEFVIDDWYMLQKFADARAQGAAAEWHMAGVLVTSQLWGTFRIHWLGLLTVFGLYHLGGHHPAFYYTLGLLLHVAVALMLWRLLVRLDFDSRMAFLAGALFLLLPTARNPLFWFPSAGQYVLAAFWLLIYLHLALGTLERGKLTAGDAAIQALVALAALFSTDQSISLVLLGAAWLAIFAGQRATSTKLAPALVVWVVAGVALLVYVRFINRAGVGGSVADRFQFSSHRILEHLRVIWLAYRDLTGWRGVYYRLPAIGVGALVAAAAGLVVFWKLRSQRGPASRGVVLGAGLWAIAVGPIWFLRWSDLRYHYLPSLGLAIVLATLCVAVFDRWHRLLFPAVAAGLVAFCAATAYAEIQQCWTPQSKHLASVKQALRDLKDLRPHDYVVVSAVPLVMGTAPHFALFACPYSATPFAETVTGVRPLPVGRELFCEEGKFRLELDSMRELQPDDLRRTHVLFTEGDLTVRVRTILACAVGTNAYQLYPLADYAGSPPLEPRVYTHDDLGRLYADIYLAHRHGR